MKKFFSTCILFAISVYQLQAQSIIVNYKDYTIDKNKTGIDSSFNQFLLPYTDSIHRSMQQVIGFSIYGMMKKQPESSLGNFMADAMKIIIEKKLNKKIDAAFINYGGIRSYLPKGNITIGNMFELMPFDNMIVLQQVSGKILKEFLNKIAEEGGWPLTGISFEIKNKTAVKVYVNNEPLNEMATYTIANSDYIANGGGGCSMLKGISYTSTGYLVRNALIDYTMMLTTQNKPIDTTIKHRITNSNE